MKVVVTGGAGFIGSNLAHALVDRADVHVIDDLSTGRRGNLPREASFHRGSILDGAILRRVFRGATHVYHLAALPSVPRSVTHPLESHAAIATGTLAVLRAAQGAGVEKVVCASSSSVYGDTPRLPKREDMTPNPQSPYAVAKLAAEGFAYVFHRLHGLRTTCLRYFNVYGPRQDPRGAYAAVVPRFVMAALNNRPLTIFGDGHQSRDFTFVGDAVRANLLASRSRRADGHAINIGGGRRITVERLSKTVRNLAGSKSPIVHAPRRAGDIRHSLADLRRARRLLGYEPRWNLERGLSQTIEWFRAHGDGRTFATTERRITRR